MNRTKFVAFICKVVYIGIEQNDREERINTVIEAAKKNLGISSSETRAIFEMMNPLNYQSSRE